MSLDIKESDWKIFRKLYEIALERFCERVLADIGRVSQDMSKTNHDRYLAVYRLVEHRDKEIARLFNDLSRSTAVLKLAGFRRSGLVSDEEVAPFTEELRERLKMIANL